MQMRPPGAGNEPVVVSPETRRQHQLLTSMPSSIANLVRWRPRRYHSDVLATVQPRGESIIVRSDGSKDHPLW